MGHHIHTLRIQKAIPGLAGRCAPKMNIAATGARGSAIKAARIKKPRLTDSNLAKSIRFSAKNVETPPEALAEG